MDPLSISASVAGLWTASAAVIDAVKCLIAAYRDADNDIINLAQELASLRLSIELVRGNLSGLENRTIPKTSDFEPFNLCWETLQELKKLLPSPDEQKNFKQSAARTRLSFLAKFKWIRQKEKTGPLLERLQRHKSTISIFISGQQLNVLREGLERQDYILAEMNKRIQDKLDVLVDHQNSASLRSYFCQVRPLEWLQKAAANHQSGTGVWFIEGKTFTHWSESDEGKLWIYGIPGAGKTVLASMAITASRLRASQSSSSAVAYFFCDYKTLESLKINTIIGSLLYQLAAQDKDASEALSEFHSDIVSLHSSVTSVPLADLCKAFTQIASFFKSVSIIVDGLDECDHQAEVTGSLAALSGGDASLRMLFFSRDEPDIRVPLEARYFEASSVAADNDDIRVYVAAQVEERIHNKELSVESEDLKIKIQEKLTDGAQGMFRWVECQLDALCDISVEDEIFEALEDLPIGIHETYSRILSRISRLPPREVTYVMKALKWICLSKVPLALAALAEIIVLKHDGKYETRRGPYHAHKLLRYCGSFLRHNDTYGTIELAHYSVKEYLLKLEGEPELMIFQINEEEDQTELGKDCLGYLLLKDYSFNSGASREEHAQLLRSRPFRGYAVTYWHHHCINSDQNFRDGLFHLTQQLFSPDKNSSFESFIHESYFWKFNYPTMSRVANTVSNTLPIHWACSLRIPELVAWLIEKDPDSVHAMTRFGAPLHCALQNSLSMFRPFNQSFHMLVKALLDGKADVNQSFRQNGRQVISTILNTLDNDTGVLLLQAGVLCDRQCLEELRWTLFDAVEERNVLESDRPYWCDKKAKRKFNGPGPQPPGPPQPSQRLSKYSGPPEQVLIFHVKSQNVEKGLSLLGDGSVDVNLSDASGLCALHYAAFNSNAVLLKALLESGADRHKRDDVGGSAAHYVATSGQGELLDLLLLEPASYLDQDNMGWTPLHVASQSGNWKVISRFCENEQNIQKLNPVDREGFTPFHIAARSGQLQCLQELLKYLSSEDIGRKTDSGNTALHLACLSGSLSTVHMLLDKGLDPNDHSEDMSTPLHMAMAVHDFGIRADIIEALLDHQADPKLIKSDGNFPLHLYFEAFARGPCRGWSMKHHRDVLRRFFDLSSGCANIKNEKGQTPLHKAALTGALGDAEIFAMFIDHGHDMFIEDNEGQSSFQLLLERYFENLSSMPGPPPPPPPGAPYGPRPPPGPSAVASLNMSPLLSLIRRAVDRYPKNPPTAVQVIACKYLTRALASYQWAVSTELVRLVDDLLRHDSPADERPIFLASRLPCPLELFQTIMKKTSDMSLVNIDGWTPLHLAVESGMFTKVQAILEHDPESIHRISQNRRYNTPILNARLYTAIGQEIALYMIDKGADVHFKNGASVSVMHLACETEYLDVLKQFPHSDLRNAGHINCFSNGRDWGGTKCLHLATLAKSLRAVQYLIEEVGMDVDEPSVGNSETSLHIAAFFGDIHMAKYLLSKGADVNESDSAGNTPLSLAFHSTDPEIAQILLDNGATLPSDIKSTVHLEALTWRKPEMRNILKKSMKSRTDAGALSLEEVLSVDRDVTSKYSGAVDTVLLQGLRYSIDEDNADLCNQIIHRRATLDASVDECGKCGPLVYATRLRRSKLALTLIQKGANVNQTTCDAHDTAGFDAAHYAANLGDEPLLKAILSHGYQSPTSRPHPLHIAVIRNFVGCVKVILDFLGDRKVQLELDEASSPDAGPPRSGSKSLDVKVYNERRVIDIPVVNDEKSWPWHKCGYRKGFSPNKFWSPLHTAVDEEIPAIVDLLLSRGADVNALDEDGATPLHIAAGYGGVDMVERLLNKGADPEIKTFEEEQTPFWSALLDSHFEAAIKLLSPASAHSRKKGGWNALHITAEFGNEELATKLIEMGVEVDVRSDQQNTPLHEACSGKLEARAIKMTEFLLKTGADVNAHTAYGRTPITFAVQKGFLELCKVLIKNGANVFDVPSHEPSLLKWAISNGRVEVAKWLLSDYPCMMTLKCCYGCTALHFGMENNEPAMHELTLDTCKDPDFDCDNSCGSLLNDACRESRHLVVKEFHKRTDPALFKRLCEKSSAIFAPPLVTAVRAGSNECVEALLDAGADIDIRSPEWESPLIKACNCGRLEIVKLLVKRGAKTSYTNHKGDLISAVEAAKGHEKVLEWIENYLTA